MKRIDSAVPGLAPGGTIRLRSELPIGRGFGSSAALCVALAEAALAAAGTPEAIRHRSLVWSIAHHAESYFHGSPSGIDTGLAALGGLLAFMPRPPELPETWRIVMPSLNLVVGSLPRAEGAKALIAKIAQAASPAASPAELTLGQLGALAESATTLLSQASYDPADLGALATEAEGLLAGLGLVDPGVAKLIELGRETGALGGKMSGAGGGGAFFLVYADEDAALRGCRDLGKKAERLGFGGDLTLEPLLLARAPDVGA
jgi:mevalonate kinase